MGVRLLTTLVAPTVLVWAGMVAIGDVRWAFLLYVLGGCGLIPWMLLGARPLRAGAGLPWATADQRRGFRWSSLAAFLVFGPGFLVLYAALRESLTAPRVYISALQSLGWNPEQQGTYLVLFVALVPLFEEWWWRGQALPRCEMAFGRAAGWLVAATAFAAYHVVVLWVLYEPPLALLRWAGILGAGLVWTKMAQRERSWHWVYFAHLGADAALVAGFLLWVQNGGV